VYRGLGASITPAKSSGGLFPKITFDESSNLKNLPLETPRTRQVSNLDDYLLNGWKPISFSASRAWGSICR
jgi:hypothetical protein